MMRGLISVLIEYLQGDTDDRLYFCIAGSSCPADCSDDLFTQTDQNLAACFIGRYDIHSLSSGLKDPLAAGDFAKIHGLYPVPVYPAGFIYDLSVVQRGPL